MAFHSAKRGFQIYTTNFTAKRPKYTASLATDTRIKFFRAHEDPIGWQNVCNPEAPTRLISFQTICATCLFEIVVQIKSFPHSRRTVLKGVACFINYVTYCADTRCPVARLEINHHP